MGINYFSIPGMSDIAYSKKHIDPNWRMPKIIESVCQYFDKKADDMFSKDRHVEMVHARQVLQYLLYNYTRMTKEAIGDYFGIDHSTVVHSTNKITTQRATYPKIDEELTLIEGKILS